MESHRKGELTEAIVIAELKRREIPVSIPFGDNERYDLIVETNDCELFRIQVKTGWSSNGKIHFHGSSQHTNSKGNVYKSYDGEVDYFLVYSYELESMYLIPEDSFETSMSLRISDPKRMDRSIKWATDYEFDKRWPPSDSRGRGARSEPSTIDRVVEAFLEEGISVATVAGDESHDLITETSGQEYARVQVKPGWKVDGRIRFNPTSADDIDYVAIYNWRTENIYTISTNEFDESISLRVDEPKQTHASINWAEDFEFPRNWP